MPHARTLREPAPDDRFDRDRPEHPDDPDILATRPVSQVPAPTPYRIASLEHWLDLCA